jgi:hypothetical protein
MMVKYMVELSSQENNYYSHEGDISSKDPPSTTPPNVPLTFEKPTFEPAIFLPKGVLRCTTHNVNAQATQ